jgi:hypothetical protein
MTHSQGRTGWCVATLATLTFANARPASAQTSKYHHGIYVRVAGGLGFFSDAVDSDPLPPLGSTAEGTLKGVAINTELAVGGSIAPGLVLGGALFVNHMPSLKTTDGQIHTGSFTTFTNEIDFDPTTLTVIGPFGDYYFDPTGGFHVQASLGYGILSLGQGRGAPIPIRDQTGSGFSAEVGVGYEWWVSSSWGVGVLGQLMFGLGSGKDTGDNTWRHRVLIPGLLVSATMN